MAITLSPTTVTELESKIARDSSRRLASRLKNSLHSQHLEQAQSVKVQIAEGEGPDETLDIPTAALRLLIDILDEMADGNTVTLVPSRAELTSQQAASFLNVSRPYLIRLLESGQIPYHKAGTHRRIHSQDLLDYKAQNGKERRVALQELAALSQELDMGY